MPPDRIVVDPGIGFAKRAEHSFEILARLETLAALGRPILAGPSRKSFMKLALGERPPDGRDWGTAAAVTAAILGGAHIVRVHAVREMADAARVADTAHRLATQLRTLPGLVKVSDSTVPRTHWRLQLDAEALERHEITLAEIGRAFAIARDGLVIGDGLDGERRLPLRLRLAPDVAGPAFERLLLRGEQRQQRAVYLRDVGVTLRVNAPAEQLRIQRLPAAEVRAGVTSSQIPAPPARLREVISLPEGYFLEWTGGTARGR